MDKYFTQVDVTIRDYNDHYGRSEQLSEDDIIRLGDALKAIRRAELRVTNIVRHVANPYG